MSREITSTNTLQNTGDRLVRELNLSEILNKYGEAHLVGNLALHTTVKPDIDYLIYCNRADWAEIIPGLKANFEQTNHTDFEERELKESGKYLVTFKHTENGTEWSIDITLSEKGGDYLSDSYQFYLDFKDKFTPGTVDTIIPIKEYFYSKRMLRNSMSYYIYRAVIDEGATKVADIYDYLIKNNIYLGKFKK
jgi:hypothetical protein